MLGKKTRIAKLHHHQRPTCTFEGEGPDSLHVDLKCLFSALGGGREKKKGGRKEERKKEGGEADSALGLSRISEETPPSKLCVENLSQRFST